MRRAIVLACALALVACGAKTGLTTPDASVDAAVVPVDAVTPRDAPLVDAFVPADDCIALPPAEPRELVVDYVARIDDADVYFLVDVTGSMGGEIEAIQARIADTIAPGIARAIPQVRFSLGRFADYPLDEFGTIGDDVFRLVEPSTSDLPTLVAATRRLVLESGGDPPEAYVPALYFSAAARGAPGFVPAPRCADGEVGYPCFSSTGARIFLLFTDAEAHDGPGEHDPYSSDIVPAPPTYLEAVTALRSIGAKVVGIYSGTPDDGAGLADVTALARDTGAVTSDGTPLVFSIGGDGVGLDATVIDAVDRLVRDVPIAVDVLLLDEPGDEVDATTFVRGVVTNGAMPADGAIDRGDHFDAVVPGTRVSFRLLLENDVLPRTAAPQHHRLRVVLRGDAVTRLEERVVDLVVPGLDGRACD